MPKYSIGFTLLSVYLILVGLTVFGLSLGALTPLIALVAGVLLLLGI